MPKLKQALYTKNDLESCHRCKTSTAVERKEVNSKMTTEAVFLLLV